MRNTSENKVLKYNSRFLGAVIFMFGFLKFFEPFQTWFHLQIARSGLPPISVPLGIAGEIFIGLSLLLTSFFRRRLRSVFTPIVALASAGLIVNMAVAIYVHVAAEVPADVLPLGIKPPFIPLAVVLLAGLNLFQLLRTNEKVPSVIGHEAEGTPH
jgi:hypothetical protein